MLKCKTDAQGIARVTLARPERHDAFDQASDVVDDWLWFLSGNGRRGWSA